MMALETALSFLWRHWRAVAGATVAIAVLAYVGILKGEVSHWHKLADNLAQQNKMLEAVYSASAQTARANNIEAVRKAETDGAAISERKQHDLETQLADARSLADAYARRMRSAPGANQGGAGQTSIPAASGGPGGADATGVSVIPSDDLRICAEQTVKVKGWIDFYSEVRARYNALNEVDAKP